MPRLIFLSINYRQSFLEALIEYQEEYRETANPRLERYVKMNPVELAQDFAGFVEKLRNQAHGEGLPQGYVPNSVYWLVDGNKYIGWADIRHHLTPNLREVGGHIGYDIRPSERRKGFGKLLLNLALVKARELGIKDVLVTCDTTNVGSKKIIEANGGQYENTATGKSGQSSKLRYWISI